MNVYTFEISNISFVFYSSSPLICQWLGIRRCGKQLATASLDRSEEGGTATLALNCQRKSVILQVVSLVVWSTKPHVCQSSVMQSKLLCVLIVDWLHHTDNLIFPPLDRLRDTLIHEMCHSATWLINGIRDGHGRFWKLYARKSTLVHPELPVVTRCHSYDITYKFQYQCTVCKNTYVEWIESINFLFLH